MCSFHTRLSVFLIMNLPLIYAFKNVVGLRIHVLTAKRDPLTQVWSQRSVEPNITVRNSNAVYKIKKKKMFPRTLTGHETSHLGTSL